ncbi:MAG: hypothetical protein M3388_13080 [Acidobacteriota bacterium]|nr:hypothetical protein [Acidobacteriota bacterium]
MNRRARFAPIDYVGYSGLLTTEGYLISTAQVSNITLHDILFSDFDKCIYHFDNQNL